MAGTHPGLALSPAQRNLVDKGRAVQRAKSETDAIKRAIEESSRRHIEETKQRCRAHHEDRDARARDRKLIIRHVGEELARISLRGDCNHHNHHTAKKPAGKHAHQAGGLRKAANNNGDSDSGKVPQPANGNDDDGYDEERFGPVRRLPRQRKPNLWVQVFEKETEEVKQEREEVKRRHMATAAELRQALAQQEADKISRRKADQQREDAYAKLQEQQFAAWKEQEKEKERKRLEAAERETKRCKEEFKETYENQLAAQKKKEQQELKTIARYNAMLEDEKRQRELKKQRVKEEFELVAQANAMQLAIKQKEKLFDQEEEVRLQHAYEKKLAMQEEARQRELQEVLAKQSRRVKMALLNVKSAEEKAREDEERAAIIQAQVRQRDEQERLRRELKKKEIIAVQAQALKVQKAEKRHRFQKEANDEELYAAQFKQEYLEWVQKQKDKQVQVKQRNFGHEKLVIRQMKEDSVRHANVDKYGMTKREMALNAELLRKIGLERPPSDAAPR